MAPKIAKMWASRVGSVLPAKYKAILFVGALLLLLAILVCFVVLFKKDRMGLAKGVLFNVEPHADARGPRGPLIRALVLPGGPGIASIAIAQDGKLLAASCSDGSVELWSLQNPKVLYMSINAHNAGRAIALAEDGQSMACVGARFNVLLWDVKTRSVIKHFRGHTDEVTALAFQANGTLASCSCDGTVRTWDVANGKELASLKVRVRNPWDMSFTSDGRYVAVAGLSSTVRVWDVAARLEKAALTATDDHYVHCVTFVGDSKILAYGSYDTVTLFDVESAKTIGVLRARPNSTIERLASTKDGKLLASASTGAEIILWDTSSLKEVERFFAHLAGPSGLAFTPDGRTLITSCIGIDFADRRAEGEVKLWQVP